MSATIERITEECRALAEERGAERAVVDRLAELDVDILDAIKVVRRVCGVSLGEAKRLVTSHPKWRAAAESAQTLHDEFEETLIPDNE